MGWEDTLLQTRFAAPHDEIPRLRLEVHVLLDRPATFPKSSAAGGIAAG